MENLYNEKARRIYLYDKAKEIVERLGKHKLTTYVRDQYSGETSYYADCVYSGYGLKVIKYDENRRYDKGVRVYFADKPVLDQNTYIQGSWEEVLIELHQSINAILIKEEEDKIPIQQKNFMIDTLKKITRAGVINAGNGLKIVADEHMSGAYDEWYRGTDYKVYYNGLVVFDAFYSGDSYISHIHRRYVSGDWESKIVTFAKYYEIEKRKMEQKQREESIANESVRQLKKLRGNY